MDYAWDILITADTKASSPKEQLLRLNAGVITKVEVKFPSGQHGMVKVRLYHEDSQLIPLSRGEWVTGDDEAVVMSEYFELKNRPWALKFKGCSPGTTYDHTVTVRITVLLKIVASMIPVIELLTKLLEKMGVM